MNRSPTYSVHWSLTSERLPNICTTSDAAIGVRPVPQITPPAPPDGAIEDRPAIVVALQHDRRAAPRYRPQLPMQQRNAAPRKRVTGDLHPDDVHTHASTPTHSTEQNKVDKMMMKEVTTLSSPPTSESVEPAAVETPTLTGLVDRDIRPALPDLLGDGYQSRE